MLLELINKFNDTVREMNHNEQLFNSVLHQIDLLIGKGNGYEIYFNSTN